MPRAGRRRSVVWTCFVENAESGKRRVLCRFCQHDIVANPIRMVRHIIKHCPNADEQHKRICREYQTLTVPARRRSADADATQAHDDASAMDADAEPAALQPIDVAAMTMASAPQVSMSGSPSPSPSLSFSLSHALQFPLAGSSIDDADAQHRAAQQRTSATNDASTTTNGSDSNTADRVHDEIVLALASTSGSLELLDNAHFGRALDLLHAKPLSLEVAMSHVLPRLYTQVKAEANVFLRAATIQTVQLTTTSIQCAPALEWFAADQEHRQVVLDSFTTHRSGDISEIVQERLRLLPRKPQSPLLICTDVFGETPRAVVAATQQSSDHVEAPVFAVGCLMQASLSLLATVVGSAPTIRRAIDACVWLSDAVAPYLAQLRQETQPSIDFKHYHVGAGGPCLMIAVVDQVLRHRSVIQKLSPQLPDDLVHVIHNQRFWTEATLARDLLRPFGFLFALSECGHLTSSLVLTSWFLVSGIAANWGTLSVPEKQAVEDAVVSRINDHGQPLGLICLLLDPRCRGLGLSALGKRKVRAMVAATAFKLDPRVKQSQLLAHLVKFLNKEQPFDDEGSWNMMASLPRLFWIEFMAEAPELASVALVALGLRPFIRSMQDTWSTLRTMSAGRSEKPAHDYASLMHLLAMQTQLQAKHAGDYRQQAVEDVARALISDPGSRIADAEEGDNVVYLDGHESELWQQLKHTVESLVRTDGDVALAATETEAERVEASWFAVDSPEAVDQLHACLHRALLGEMTYMRSTAGVSEDGDGSAGDVSSSSSAAATATSASDALSGLMDL